MRTELEWEMTDDLARAGNALVVRRLLRGSSWKSALVWWLLSLVAFLYLIGRPIHGVFIILAGLACGILFLVLAVTALMPMLHEVRLKRYLEQLALWPHRQVNLALTPDLVELTTPTGAGLIEMTDLQEVIPDDEVTVLLFKGGIAVPLPTSAIPAEARALLHFPADTGRTRDAEAPTGG